MPEIPNEVTYTFRKPSLQCDFPSMPRLSMPKYKRRRFRQCGKCIGCSWLGRIFCCQSSCCKSWKISNCFKGCCDGCGDCGGCGQCSSCCGDCGGCGECGNCFTGCCTGCKKPDCSSCFKSCWKSVTCNGCRDCKEVSCRIPSCRQCLRSLQCCTCHENPDGSITCLAKCNGCTDSRRCSDCHDDIQAVQGLGHTPRVRYTLIDHIYIITYFSTQVAASTIPPSFMSESIHLPATISVIENDDTLKEIGI